MESRKPSKKTAEKALKAEAMTPPPQPAPQAKPQTKGDFGDGFWRFLVWASKRLALAAIGATTYSMFYLAGYVNFQGSLGVYGIDNHDFPQPASEYFTLAARAYAEAFSSTIHDESDLGLFAYLITAAVVVIGLVMVPMIQFSEKRNKELAEKEAGRIAKGEGPSMIYRLRAFMTSWEPLWLKIPVLGGAVSLLVWVFLAYVFVSILIFTYVPYVHGVTDSLEDKRKFYPCKDQRFVRGEICVYLMDHDKVVASGIRVATSEALVAIYDGYSATVYPRAGLTEFVPNRNPPKATQTSPKTADAASHGGPGKAHGTDGKQR